jgi:hypothetical protein
LINPATQTVVAAIPLGGEPEYAQAAAETGLIYQNLEDTGELVVIDPRKQAVINRYPLTPGERPTGLAFAAWLRTNQRPCARALCKQGNRPEHALVPFPFCLKYCEY